MSAATDGIVPDTKDWTWVLDRPCPDCGFDPSAQSLADLPRPFHDTAMAWSGVLARADVADRPRRRRVVPAGVRLPRPRRARALRPAAAADARRGRATFANWDQDATAVERDYGSQDPAAVAVELIEAAGTVAGVYATVTDATAARGIRSNGDEFTVETLGSYHLHDVVHHLHDVGAG